MYLFDIDFEFFAKYVKIVQYSIFLDVLLPCPGQLYFWTGKLCE
jgi:hypothetical protein